MPESSYSKRVLMREFGNLAVFFGFVALNADAADTQLKVMDIPQGTRLMGFDVVYDNLGAGTSFDIGEMFPDEDGTDSENVYADGIVSTAAGTQSIRFHPITTAERRNLIFTLRGAAGTGRVSIHPIYEYRGTM